MAMNQILPHLKQSGTLLYERLRDTETKIRNQLPALVDRLQHQFAVSNLDPSRDFDPPAQLQENMVSKGQGLLTKAVIQEVFNAVKDRYGIGRAVDMVYNWHDARGVMEYKPSLSEPVILTDHVLVQLDRNRKAVKEGLTLNGLRRLLGPATRYRLEAADKQPHDPTAPLFIVGNNRGQGYHRYITSYNAQHMPASLHSPAGPLQELLTQYNDQIPASLALNRTGHGWHTPAYSAGKLLLLFQDSEPDRERIRQTLSLTPKQAAFLVRHARLTDLHRNEKQMRIQLPEANGDRNEWMIINNAMGNYPGHLVAWRTDGQHNVPALTPWLKLLAADPGTMRLRIGQSAYTKACSTPAIAHVHLVPEANQDGRIPAWYPLDTALDHPVYKGPDFSINRVDWPGEVLRLRFEKGANVDAVAQAVEQWLAEAPEQRELNWIAVRDTNGLVLDLDLRRGQELNHLPHQEELINQGWVEACYRLSPTATDFKFLVDRLLAEVPHDKLEALDPVHEHYLLTGETRTEPNDSLRDKLTKLVIRDYYMSDHMAQDRAIYQAQPGAVDRLLELLKRV